MSITKVQMYKIACDGCEKYVLKENRDLPTGWTDSEAIDLGMSTQGIELCADCACEPESAKKRARAKWTATQS